MIVVDGPAAGHAITFLTAAAGLADAVSCGPVRAQADDVLELLHDPERCQVVLVTLPETTPVNEVVETAYALEDEVGVQLGPVVVNGVDVGDALPDDAAVRAATAGLDRRPRRIWWMPLRSGGRAVRWRPARSPGWPPNCRFPR